MDSLFSLKAKYQALQKSHDELKSENKSMKVISNNQSRALKKIENENDYPARVKGLMEELRYYKEKLKEQQEECKKERKTSQDMAIQNSVIKKQLRDLRQRKLTTLS